MIFTELRFLVFLLPVLACYWVIRNHKWRSILLLAGSYLFYACWDWRFLFLIAFSTLTGFFTGQRIFAASSQREKRFWLTCAVVVNLTILGFFKYYNFFAESLVRLAGMVGLSISDPTLRIILPVGISFFTFESLSYAVDVYRGKLRPTNSLTKFALFTGFFPHLVAGPIVRPDQFLPQLETPRTRKHVDVRWALMLFLMGFIKKACISDNLSPFADAYFRDPAVFHGSSACLAVLLYATQIYCDFSGYTDMAIAVSGLFGYRLTENFDAPYLARSVTDFWHRWHISLSTWLRDYLYIPLGGNRYGKLNTHRNIVLTMLLGGLWHGASWNFVLWGFMHGIALSLHKQWLELCGPKRSVTTLGTLLAWMITMIWVCLAWVPFRSSDFGGSLQVWYRIAVWPAAGPANNQALPAALWAILAALLLMHYIINRGDFGGWWRKPSAMGFAGAYGAAWAVVVGLKATATVPFIYFQF